MSQQYKIGQILYIISAKTQAVIPVQVQEINTKTTIRGDEMSFLVQDTENKGPHNLADINGKICINSSDVSKFLKENANKAIDAMVNHAVSIAKEKFGSAGGVDDVFPSKKKGVINQETPPMRMVENEEEDGLLEAVEVIGKDGTSSIQKTKIRSIQMPTGEKIEIN